MDEIACLFPHNRAFDAHAFLTELRHHASNVFIDFKTKHHRTVRSGRLVFLRSGVQANREALAGVDGGPVVAETIGGASGTRPSCKIRLLRPCWKRKWLSCRRRSRFFFLPQPCLPRRCPARTSRRCFSRTGPGRLRPKADCAPTPFTAN